MTMAMTMTMTVMVMVMVMVMVRIDDDDDDDDDADDADDDDGDGDNEPKLPLPRVPLTSCMGAAGSDRSPRPSVAWGKCSRYRYGNDSASHTPGQYPPRPSRTTRLFGVWGVPRKRSRMPEGSKPCQSPSEPSGLFKAPQLTVALAKAFPELGLPGALPNTLFTNFRMSSSNQTSVNAIDKRIHLGRVLMPE